MEKTKKEQINVRIDPELKKLIKIQAIKENKTLDKLIIEIIKKYLEEGKKL